MGERAQAAAGCLTAGAGAGTGLGLWAVRADGRWYVFEQGTDYSLLYAELPLFVIGGVAAALGLWAVVDRIRARRPGP
ncbi:hypothetical protein [Streptomyces minutiscleroticus]|nr:hypothetical protein [Streptomyces minutiscleroticus]